MRLRMLDLRFGNERMQAAFGSDSLTESDPRSFFTCVTGRNGQGKTLLLSVLGECFNCFQWGSGGVYRGSLWYEIGSGRTVRLRLAANDASVTVFPKILTAEEWRDFEEVEGEAVPGALDWRAPRVEEIDLADQVKRRDAFKRLTPHIYIRTTRALMRTCRLGDPLLSIMEMRNPPRHARVLQSLDGDPEAKYLAMIQHDRSASEEEERAFREAEVPWEQVSACLGIGISPKSAGRLKSGGAGTKEEDRPGDEMRSLGDGDLRALRGLVGPFTALSAGIGDEVLIATDEPDAGLGPDRTIGVTAFARESISRYRGHFVLATKSLTVLSDCAPGETLVGKRWGGDFLFSPLTQTLLVGTALDAAHHVFETPEATEGYWKGALQTILDVLTLLPLKKGVSLPADGGQEFWDGLDHRVQRQARRKRRFRLPVLPQARKAGLGFLKLQAERQGAKRLDAKFFVSVLETLADLTGPGYWQFEISRKLDWLREVNEGKKRPHG